MTESWAAWTYLFSTSNRSSRSNVGDADEGPKWAAVAVTIGLALSLVPIVLRVLPPLAKDAASNQRDPDYAVTIVELLLDVVAVAGVLMLLDIE